MKCDSRNPDLHVRLYSVVCIPSSVFRRLYSDWPIQIAFTAPASSEAPTGRVFGGPSENSLFAPYQGEWHFEFRKLEPEPEQMAIKGGPEISITGHIIRFGSGMFTREIRLCQTRETKFGIECEAWHHEDIHDPGDMQRADCKLVMDGDNLVLHWRIVSSGKYSDDPIVASEDYVLPDRSRVDSELTWWIETYTRKSSN